MTVGRRGIALDERSRSLETDKFFFKFAFSIPTVALPLFTFRGQHKRRDHRWPSHRKGISRPNAQL